MNLLPAFCKFYHVQPSEFWRLGVDELEVMGDWMRDYQKAVEEANRA